MPGLVDEYTLEFSGDVRSVVNAESMTQIQMFQDQDVLASFEFAPKASTDAVAALLAGDVEMVLSYRRITEREIDTFLSRGLGDLTSPEREAVIALDAIVPLVPSSSSVRSVNLNQLAAVLSG